MNDMVVGRGISDEGAFRLDSEHAYLEDEGAFQGCMKDRHDSDVVLCQC